MEIAKDFAKRMTAQAEGIPREVVAALLTRLMPKVPVTRRPPATQSMEESYFNARPSGDRLPPPPIRDAFTGQARRTRKRRPSSRAFHYEVTPAGKYAQHRGWRGAMVRAAQQHTLTSDAEAWLASHYPEHVAKGIDWSWLQATAEYIKPI